MSQLIEKYKTVIIDHLVSIIKEDCPPRTILETRLFMCASSLRLSYWGFKVIKKHYVSHSFDFADKDLICGALAAIDDRISAPYYISAKKFYLFGKYDAFMAILNDNDVLFMLKKASKWAE